MAEIDDIISGVSGNTRADFSGIGNLPKAYWEGQDQKAKNDLRDAFKGGLPMKGDQVDWPAVTQKFFSVGAVDQGISAAGQSLAQQKMEYGQKLGESAFPTEKPAQAPIVTPPSASAPRLKEVAAPLNKGGVQGPGQSPQGDQVTPKSYLAKLGLHPGYNMEVGLAAFKRNGIEPDQPFNPNDPNLAKVMPAMQRMGNVGQVQPPQPGDGQPPQQAPQVAQSPMPQGAPQMQAPQMQPAQAQPDFNQRFSAARPGQGSDPTLGGLVPAGRTPQQQIDGLTKAISSNMLTPEVAKTYQSRIDAITKALEPTNPIKEYDKAVSQGFKGTIQEWMDRADDNTTQRDILTKSTIPRLEKSQDKATSAIEDIDAIHRSRNELDQPGGVITGVWANDRLKLSKIGNSLGITDADKITNTEAFSAAVGKRVAAMVKAFGSGTAISDGDRRFAEKMAGGGIELNETSMRRILDIGEQADRAVIGRHNEFADTAVKSNDGLKSARDTFIVKQPGLYKKPDQQQTAPSPSSGSAQAATMVSSKADYDKLPKGAKFTGPDGKPWLKP